MNGLNFQTRAKQIRFICLDQWVFVLASVWVRYRHGLSHFSCSTARRSWPENVACKHM